MLYESKLLAGTWHIEENTANYFNDNICLLSYLLIILCSTHTHTHTSSTPHAFTRELSKSSWNKALHGWFKGSNPPNGDDDVDAIIGCRLGRVGRVPICPRGPSDARHPTPHLRPQQATNHVAQQSTALFHVFSAVITFI